MAKVDVMLTAEFSQILVANTAKSDHISVATLSDATIFQVLEIQAVEIKRMGNAVLTGNNPVYANLQLLETGTTTEQVPSGSASGFLYQFGELFGAGHGSLQSREVLTLPLMVTGETFNVGSFVKSVAAGTLVTAVSIYGNYKRLSEVDYLRLTCGVG